MKFLLLALGAYVLYVHAQQPADGAALPSAQQPNTQPAQGSNPTSPQPSAIPWTFSNPPPALPITPSIPSRGNRWPGPTWSGQAPIQEKPLGPGGTPLPIFENL